MTDGHYIMGKMWWLLRPSALREPLPVTMSGVRAGERLLQIHVDDPAIAAAIAAKVGLNGEAAIVVWDEHAANAAQNACANVGALVDIRVVPSLSPLPHDTGHFDVVILDGSKGLLASMDRGARTNTLGEARRVLRPGGRLVALAPGARAGLGALFRSAPPAGEFEAEGGTAKALETAGFRPVRVLADRGGIVFVEGVRS